MRWENKRNIRDHWLHSKAQAEVVKKLGWAFKSAMEAAVSLNSMPLGQTVPNQPRPPTLFWLVTKTGVPSGEGGLPHLPVMSRCVQKTQELGSSSPSTLNDSMDTVILPTSHNGLDTFRILASTRACADEQGMKSGSPGEPPRLQSTGFYSVPSLLPISAVSAPSSWHQREKIPSTDTKNSTDQQNTRPSPTPPELRPETQTACL